jgi:NADP-dependent 3-hydroxy acid dehydrogenase YdfG
LDDWEKMIDTNLKGLLYNSREIIPIMVERRKGHIINIGSIAGKETYLKGNVYCATKHAVDSLTKAMRMDLLHHGIKVSSVSPGMVETEFSEVRLGNKEAAKKVYEGLIPLLAEDIAETVDFILSRPSHVTINDIIIMPTAQANSTLSYRSNV